MRDIGLTIDSYTAHRRHYHTQRSVIVLRLHDNRLTCEYGSNPSSYSTQ